MIFERASASCFVNSSFFDLAIQFRERGLLMAGLGAERGVLATSLDAHALGVRTGVLMDLCGAESSEDAAVNAGMVGMLMIIRRLSLDMHSSAVFSAA